MPVTNVMGGFGRVLLGGDGKPSKVLAGGPVALTFAVPGVTRTESDPAQLIGPVALTFAVPGLTRTMSAVTAEIGPVALTFNVPGVTRS